MHVGGDGFYTSLSLEGCLLCFAYRYGHHGVSYGLGKETQPLEAYGIWDVEQIKRTDTSVLIPLPVTPPSFLLLKQYLASWFFGVL